MFEMNQGSTERENDTAVVTSRSVEMQQYESIQIDQATEEVRASAAIYDEDGLSDGDEANQSKREVDKVIAEELKQQEDSYIEPQITSLQIDNGMHEQEKDIIQAQMAHEMENQARAEMMVQEDPNELGYDSDEEFRIMDEQIAAQVLHEKRRQQFSNGAKLQKQCAQVGRCSICTLMPPCKHQKAIDQNIAEDMLGMSPAQVSKLRNMDKSESPERHVHNSQHKTLSPREQQK